MEAGSQGMRAALLRTWDFALTAGGAGDPLDGVKQ